MLLAQLARDALGVPPQRPPQALGVAAVGAERGLGTDRLRCRRRLDGAIVATEGQVVEVPAVLTEAPRQRRGGNALELADGRDAHPRERLRQYFPHSPQPLDGQRREETGLGAGWDDHQAVGLPEVRSHLGHELVRGKSGRSREARVRPDPGLDPAHGLVGRPEECLRP